MCLGGTRCEPAGRPNGTPPAGTPIARGRNRARARFFLSDRGLERGSTRRAVRFGTGQGIQDGIVSHSLQPCAKFRPFWVMLPLLDRLGDRRQDFLGYVLRVGRLHPLMLGEPQDDRPVDLDELLPCRPIRRIADADQQAGSCFRGRTHQGAPSLISYTEARPKSDKFSSACLEDAPAPTVGGRDMFSQATDTLSRQLFYHTIACNPHTTDDSRGYSSRIQIFSVPETLAGNPLRANPPAPPQRIIVPTP